MKPKIAQQKISAALLVTLLAIGSASAIADFQGIDDALKPYHSHLLIGTANVNIEVDTSTGQARDIADAPTATANSRLLESSYSGDALLYTLGLDFLANN